MSRKFIYDHLISYGNKYNFEYNNYIPPSFKDGKSEERRISKGDLNLINPTINLEAFKNVQIPIKPKICTYEFMTKLEIEIVKHETPEKLFEIFESKLKKLRVKGIPKKLLIDLFISIVQFSNKYKFGIPQTAAMLSMFYNTHFYFSCHLFAPAEEIYAVFKEYICCHSISVPPYKIKLFDQNEANKLMGYFCSIYLRNLPLIRTLMLPNFGLMLQIRNPESEEAPVKKGKKKGKK